MHSLTYTRTQKIPESTSTERVSDSHSVVATRLTDSALSSELPIDRHLPESHEAPCRTKEVIARKPERRSRRSLPSVYASRP